MESGILQLDDRTNKKIDKMNLVQEKNQPVKDEDEDW